MGRGFLSRRSFVKLSAATMAVAGLSSGGGSALAETGAPQSSDIKRIRTCCRGCGKMECGVWVTVENGRAVKVEGDTSAFQSGEELLRQVAVFHSAPNRSRAVSAQAHESQECRRSRLGSYQLG